MTEQIRYSTVDEYIAQYDQKTQETLQELRSFIRNLVPQATEVISWQMPTFRLNGNLVHFANNKKHIGFYPGASGIAAFSDKFGDYKWSKGAVQFPSNKPLPYDLIKEIVLYRVKENMV